jgi:cytochrome c oxidase cbb3-type subunit III
MLNRVPILLMFAALSTAAAPVTKRTNPLGDGVDVISAGHSLYNKTCTMCHGADGAEGERAPALAANRRYFRLSEAAIFDAIKHGISGTAMPASGLPDNDIWRIVAYIRNIRSTASDNIVPGNIENGRRVFDGKGQCSGCHMIRGQGGLIGPDLSSVGAQLTLTRLRNSLIKDRPVARGYQPVKVTTLDGRAIEGVAKDETAFSIQILDKTGKLHLFEKDELREVVHEPKSLMPHNYDQVLTPDELRDLVAMLSRQARDKVRVEQPGENEVGR